MRALKLVSRPVAVYPVLLPSVEVCIRDPSSLVLMNGLADKLLFSNTGTTLEGLFVGGALHTDDVRTVSNDKCSVRLSRCIPRQLNPLSSRSIYLACILPILLYGCENWILNDSLLDRLDCFQAWVGKRILSLTKFHNNTIIPVALDLPSTRSVILMKKLKFLAKLMSYRVPDHTSL